MVIHNCFQVDVKWFFRDDPQPFFQWLPGRPPQAIGELFRNRIDLVRASSINHLQNSLKNLKPTKLNLSSQKFVIAKFLRSFLKNVW